MSDPPANPDPPHDRRALFRQGLRRIVTPLADYLAQRIPYSAPREHLRPPGAVPETAFRQTCYRCGNCVEVCPAKAIRRLHDDDPELEGTPYINADLAACIVCEGLECMKVCPSGALRLVSSKYDIRMGMARVRQNVCIRGDGEDCTLCVDHCPIGRRAIEIDDSSRVRVHDPGCVGCGECQRVCPTMPKAIEVMPE